mgnify:CR=1 FL=1
MVKVVSFSRNFGKEGAMLAGLNLSTGDYVAIMDADLQDPPELFPQMFNLVANEGYDSVATRRVTRKGEPKIRSFFARKFYKVIKIPSCSEYISPVLSIVPLQLFAYYISKEKGLDVDKPRNLAKSVTVE